MCACVGECECVCEFVRVCRCAAAGTLFMPTGSAVRILIFLALSAPRRARRAALTIRPSRPAQPLGVAKVGLHGPTPYPDLEPYHPRTYTAQKEHC